MKNEQILKLDEIIQNIKNEQKRIDEIKEIRNITGNLTSRYRTGLYINQVLALFEDRDKIAKIIDGMLQKEIENYNEKMEKFTPLEIAIQLENAAQKEEV